jgi:hypothetical protein
VISFRIKILELPQLKNLVTSRVTPTQWHRTMSAIGAKIIFLTVQNFGQSGPYRPTPWQGLTRKYAKRVGRIYPTLDRSGKLFRSFRLNVLSRFTVQVKTSGVPYAHRHQFGTFGMPIRPYLPIDSNKHLTPYAREQVEKVAEDMLSRAIGG